ncbi:RTA1 like protein-domain-containing protein [Mycena capillaripes]|nr:RTA1 like protein-domain-containing protein [Mycena capillaripes]
MPSLNHSVRTDSASIVHSEYGYVPQEYVAVIFVSLFGLSTVLHIGQATYYRMWWLFPTAVLCGIGEIIGWSGRLWSSFSPTLHDPFMMQVVSTVIAPTPLIAVNFVLLGWIVTQLGPCYARLSPRAYTIVFLTSDIVALLAQAAGGGIASGADTFARTQLGAHIMLAGIAFQFAALITYCCLAADFLVRYTYNRPIKGRTIERRALDVGTERMIYALAFSSLVLFIRAVYRLLELGTGWHGRIMVTEVYFNVLDGGMVVLAIVVMNFAHPGHLMGPRRPQPPTEYGMKLKRKDLSGTATPDEV